MIDVREIKLDLRYPESRQEDITDAFMRGYIGAVEIGNRAIEKLEAENAKLRELVRDYERCTMHADCARCEYDGKMSTHCPLSPCFPDIDELNELGVEVEP